jgi:hypothetical protein
MKAESNLKDRQRRIGRITQNFFLHIIHGFMCLLKPGTPSD